MRRPASLRLPVALATALVASTASAQTTTYDLSDRSGTGACTQTSAGVTIGTATNLGNAYSCAAVGATATSLKVTASGTTGTTLASGFELAAVTDQGASGFGVGSQTEGGTRADGGNGNHAVDNANNGGTDLLLLEFTSGAQALRGVKLGWTSGDADFQVLRWVGGQMAFANSIDAALKAGWQLVATVNGAATGEYAFNAQGLGATYWAIGAYNAAFGTAAGVDGGDDKFKVSGLTTAAPAAVVPEPSTYALMATGLAGLLAAARRRRAA